MSTQPSSTLINIRFRDDELAALDRVRGGVPRGTYIKALCQLAAKARERFGDRCFLSMEPSSRDRDDNIELLTPLEVVDGGSPETNGNA